MICLNIGFSLHKRTICKATDTTFIASYGFRIRIFFLLCSTFITSLCLERDPLSFVSTTEELLERKVAAPV
jgi:hypothetical protein